MSLNFNDFKDYQKNPFTKTLYYTSITDEPHVIQSMLGSYMVKLYHAPRETAPSSVVITIGGTPLQEVPSTVTPANMQFRVWYDEDGLGLVDFNANQDGQTVLCSYEHYGTMHSKESIASYFQITEFIYDSTTWINAIERVSANVYKFRDDITNVYFRYLSTGYQISDILSGGDTWGEIQTNNAVNVEFENGAFIDVDITTSFIRTDTNFGILKNVGIKGDTGTSAAIDQSFLLDASNVTYDNCWTSNRASNQTWVAFKGSVTAVNKQTVQYYNCQMRSTINTAGTAYMFWNCTNIYNAVCRNNQFYAADVINNCTNINNFQVYYNTSSNQLRLIVLCENINNVNVYENTFTGTVTRLFESVYNISNVNLQTNISAATSYFYTSYQISNVYITGNTSGSFTGFASCERISNAYINGQATNHAGASNGFSLCIGIENCKVINITNAGAGTAYGYSNSNKMQQNSGSGNKTATYLTCYADAGTSNAVADTAAGGYNS